MALSFENVLKEDREMFRASTARKREAWKRDTELERLLYSTASAVATTRDEFEDAVRAAGAMAADVPEKEARLRAARRSWSRMDEVYKRLEVAAKYGLGVAEEVFDAQTEVDGITQEQEKKLGRVLKKMEENVKEKTSRKRREGGLYEELDTRGAADGGFSGGFGGGSFGPYTAAPAFWDPNFTATAPGYGYGTAPVWQGYGMPPPLSYGQPSQMFQQGNFNNAAAGGQDGAGQTTKAPIAKRKTICINCGAHDHVSYNPACTNYHIHLQQLAAKAESLRRAAAAHGGIDRTVALRDGSGEI